MSFFDSVTQLPEDAIFKLPIAFAADTRKEKVNLGIGSYKDSEGLPLIFYCVREVEPQIVAAQKSKEYLPIDGDAAFIKLAQTLLLGKDFLDSYSGGLYSAQTLGGTGALRLGCEFLRQQTSNTIFLSNPTWPNHQPLFTRGGMVVDSYAYYDIKNHRLDFEGMCRDIKQMPPGSIILLQASCHNPSGYDLSLDQWKEISNLLKQHQIIPFFDCAYQGFADTPEKDAAPIRLFASLGHEMLIAQSFSKNFGLYCDRVGLLTLLTHDKSSAFRSSTQIKQLIRSNYSNPPKLGAQIIASILASESLKQEWLDELAAMRLRIQEMRHTLVAGLQAKASYRDWSFMYQQKGFFSFCGLNESQVERLIKDYGIYMPANGRINVAALNGHNLEYVMNSIVSVGT